MAVIKVACPKCGQKVSGDETFFGSSVDCPICTAKIFFPVNPNAAQGNFDDPPLPPVGNEIPPSNLPPSHPPAAGVGSVPPEGAGISSDFSSDVPRRTSSSSVPDLADDAPVASPRNHLPEERGEFVNIPLESESRATEAADLPSPALGATSLVLGILSFVSCLSLSILTAPTAIVCGHIALARAKRYEGSVPGKSLALIGTILGYLGMACLLLLLVVVAVFGPFWKKWLEQA